MNGKALAASMDLLSTFCRDLGIQPLEAFGRVAPEVAEQFMEEFGLSDVRTAPEEWFEPEEGIAVASALIPYVKQNAQFVSDSAGIIADLQRLDRILRDARQHGVRWHLEIDF